MWRAAGVDGRGAGRPRQPQLSRHREAEARASTSAQAQADLTRISKRLDAQYPADNKDWGALVVPLQEDLVGDARPALLVLLGAVALVLLIACANLANLMLVRTHGRAKEIALRGALGASRLRVVQQLLAEGVVLGIGGGLAGFAAAYYGVDALMATFGAALPRARKSPSMAACLAFTAAIVAGHGPGRRVRAGVAADAAATPTRRSSRGRAAAARPAATAASATCWSCPRWRWR